MMSTIKSQVGTVILSLGSRPTLRRADPYLQLPDQSLRARCLRHDPRERRRENPNARWLKEATSAGELRAEVAGRDLAERLVSLRVE